MTNRIRLALWLFWAVAGASPAYANNPPAPDGMLSVILLFPVVILGWRLAGVHLTDREKKWRTLRVIVLALATLVAAAGTGIGAMALLVLFCYGLLRGIQVMTRGQGGKRFAIGSAVILFTLFAGANYLVSLSNYPSLMRYEVSGESGVRTIVTAENEFRTQAKLDANKNSVPEYGTLEQLHRAGLIGEGYLSSNARGTYRYALVITGDPTRDEKELFVYAAPRHYGTPRRTISLLDGFRPRYVRRTFAADETGVLRAADLGSSRPVTRQEAEKWEPLD